MSQGWSFLERALTAASSAIDPLLVLGAGTITALVPEAAITVLTDAIAERFVGHELELTLAGRPVRGKLNAMRVTRRKAAFEAEFDVEDVVVDGTTIDTITVFARGVRLVPGVPTRIEADQVDLIGEMAIEAVLTWLNRQGLDWELERGDDGLINATHKLFEVTVVVDAEIRQDTLRLENKASRWRSVKLPIQLLPSWSMPVGPLPGHARIVRAVRSGAAVRFTVDLPAVKGKFDLRQVRDAILAGTGLRFW